MLSFQTLLYGQEFYEEIAKQNCLSLKEKDDNHLKQEQALRAEKEKKKAEGKLNEEEIDGSYSRSLCAQLNPLPSKKRRQAFELLAKKNFTSGVLDLWSCIDLELFYGPKDKPHLNYAATIDYTSTELGKAYLYSILATPSADTNVLRTRQTSIHKLQTSPLLYELKKDFDNLANHEAIFFTLFDEDSFASTIRGLKLVDTQFESEALKKASDWYNNNTVVANICTAEQTIRLTIGQKVNQGVRRIVIPLKNFWETECVPPTVSFLIHNVFKKLNSLFGLKIDMNMEKLCQLGNDIPKALLIASSAAAKITSIPDQLISYLKLLPSTSDIPMVFQDNRKIQLLQKFAVLKNISDERAFAPYIDLSSALCKKTKKLCSYLEHMYTIKEKIEQYANSLLPLLPKLNNLSFLNTGNLINKIREFKSTSDAFDLPSLIIIYNQLIEHRDSLLQAMVALAELEAYMSIALFINNSVKEKLPICYAEYPPQPIFESPLIVLNDFYNPLIAKPIPNSVEIGNHSENKNGLVITGANAGGKSTLMRALLFNIILAQTFGIATANRLTLHPFSSIATCFNVTDSQAQGLSLHQAHAKRVKGLEEYARKSSDSHFSLIAFDEMFNGTNKIDGAALAMATLKVLSNYKNNVSITSTHFINELKQVQKEVSNFGYYMMPKRNDINKFKMQKGISSDFSGIEIAEEQGLPANIINEANCYAANFQKEQTTCSQEGSYERFNEKLHEDAKNGISENLVKRWPAFYQKFIVSILNSDQRQWLQTWPDFKRSFTEPNLLYFNEEFYNKLTLWQKFYFNTIMHCYLLDLAQKASHSYPILQRNLDLWFDERAKIWFNDRLCTTLYVILEYFISSFNLSQMQKDEYKAWWQWLFDRSEIVFQHRHALWQDKQILFTVLEHFNEFPNSKMAIDTIGRIVEENPKILLYRDAENKTCVLKLRHIQTPYDFLVFRLLVKKTLYYFGHPNEVFTLAGDHWSFILKNSEQWQEWGLSTQQIDHLNKLDFSKKD